jgi:hypothetical protein
MLDMLINDVLTVKWSVSSYVLLAFLFLAGFNGASAQRIIPINSGNSVITRAGTAGSPAGDDHLGKPEQTRRFDWNPRLKSLTRENVGDVLSLDFFNNREYRAVIQSVSRDCNGVTGIVAAIRDSRFGYCYISASESGILINAELPESDACFLATGGTGEGRLSEYRMSEVMKNDLGCDVLEPPASPEPPLSEAVHAERIPALAPAGCVNTVTDENAPATVTVLVVYTARAKAYATTRLGGIDNAISTAMMYASNTVGNSSVGITFELVHSYETSYVEVNTSADLDNLAGPGDGNMDEVHALRRKYGADLVMFVPEVNFTGGVGYLLNTATAGGSPHYGFALSRVQQFAGYTMVHEMGHNMGCHHHKEQNSQKGPGLYSYSAGWKGIAAGSSVCTVMTYGESTYWNDGTSYTRIPYFSSPDISYNSATVGDADDADNARTLRQTKHTVAFYSEIVGSTALTGLTVNGNSVAGFDPDINNYLVDVTHETGTVTIAGTAGACATVSGNVTNVPLNYGDNSFSITVLSSASAMANRYRVTVRRSVPACASYTSHPAFGAAVTAEAGSDALNLNMAAVGQAEEKTSLVMNLSSQKSGRIIVNKSSISSACYDDGKNYTINEAIVKVSVTQTGNYRFTVNTGCIFSVFKSGDISCSSFAGSNAYRNASNDNYNYSPTFAIELTAGTDYYLRAINWSGWGALTLNASISMSPGNLLVESGIPPGMGYTYVAVGKSDNRIKLQNADADFRNLPVGNYTVYGIPYSTGSNPATFAGKTLADIQSSDCVTPSATFLDMTVTSGLSSDATLSNLAVDPGTLTPAFNAATLNYAVHVANSVGSITITAAKNHAGATVTGDGSKSLNVGENTYNINVRAENGAQKTYTVKVTRDRTYSVSAGSFAGGSISVSPETGITVDTEVTITLHPSAGYRMATLGTTPQCTLFGSGFGEGDTYKFNMPSSNVTVTATFEKTQAQFDLEAVAAAKAAVEERTFTVAQQTANTEASVKTWLVNQINDLITSTGIRVSSANIAINSFTAAVTGSSGGSFNFTVTLSKGSAGDRVTKNGTILSTAVYGIIVGSYADGSVSADKTAAAQGETVTLSIVPAAGYRLASISAHRTGTRATAVPLHGSSDDIRTFTMPDYDVTVEAEFQKTQAQLDEEAVEAAKIDIEDGTFRIMQVMGNTEATVKDWLINTLKVLFGDAHGIAFRSEPIPMMGEVTLTALTPAVAGTETSPAGTNGSFRFTVALTRGAATLTAGTVEGIIIATSYSVTPLKRIELMQMGDLKLRLVNTGNTPTGDLTLELTGANADAFILPAATISSLPISAERDFALVPRAGLPEGTYHATLTVSGEGITPVSATVAHTVRSTGNDNPQEQGLKAWMQNGRLHVGGLTAGKSWRVYNFSGALIYHGVASDGEENIALSVRGLYVVVSGSQAVKVMFK